MLVLCTLLCVLSLTACGKAPKIDQLYGRVVELVEASYELNTVFYGEGLPYYDRTLPMYADLYNDYSKEQYTRDYNIVSKQAKYRSIDEIKAAAEKVYSKALLEDQVYKNAFDGVIITGAGIPTSSASARYRENDGELYIFNDVEGKNHIPTPLVYDYATMKIVRPSNAKRVLITMTVWEENTPDEPFTKKLVLTKTSDGIWLLDSLTV